MRLQPRAPALTAWEHSCISTPSPTGTQSPSPLSPAPTLRAETVARSMSGELAIILWAAKMPERGNSSSSWPVLASLPPHSQEEE